MLPTTVNALFILIGSLAGLLLRRGINEKLKLAILNAMGLSAFGIGIHSLVNGMDHSGYPVLFIVSLALGALIGNWIDFSERLEKLVARFQGKGSSGTFSLDGLITAFLIFCVGPLAILGPIKSALENDGTLIYTNAVLDLVTSAILAASFGKSVIFASPILFIWQGAIYVSALLFMKDTSPELLNELSLTGGFLIMATGLSILKIKDLKVINLLPALAVPPLFFAAKALDALMSGKRVKANEELPPLDVIVRNSTIYIPPSRLLVDRAMRIIESRGTKGLRAADVAKHLGVSPSLLNLRFQQARNCSLRDTLIAARLGEVMRLLKTSDYPVSQIAKMSGFSSSTVLNHLFKRKLGISPDRWRKAQRTPPNH